MEEKRRFLRSIRFPAIFVVVLWLIKLAEEYFHVQLGFLGVRPHTPEGLIGIFTYPFIHGGFEHLFSNTLPLLVVGTGLIYFYREVAFPVVSIVWLFSGLWVWMFARSGSTHIGASGLIYGFVSFLFLSGILRRDTRMLAVSMLVTFLYGSMVWGILPSGKLLWGSLPVNEGISWEGHLFGSIAGIIAAVYYRKEGPQRTVKVWEEEPEPTEPQYWMTDEQRKKFEQSGNTTHENTTTIHYIYEPKKENERS